MQTTLLCSCCNVSDAHQYALRLTTMPPPEKIVRLMRKKACSHRTCSCCTEASALFLLALPRHPLFGDIPRFISTCFWYLTCVTCQTALKLAATAPPKYFSREGRKGGAADDALPLWRSSSIPEMPLIFSTNPPRFFFLFLLQFQKLRRIVISVHHGKREIIRSRLCERQGENGVRGGY